MTIRNLTPHPVHLVDNDGVVWHTFPVDENGPARAATITREDVSILLPAEPDQSPGVSTIYGAAITVPTVTTVYGVPENLPVCEAGTWLIVSALTVDAARRAGRRVDDLLVPAEVVRDADGVIVGCKALGRCS